MGLRELKAERTRTALAEAALDLFERQGYDATTMEQIAAAAEVSTTTLYNYFPTKDSTLLSHLRTGSSTLGDDVRSRPSSEPLDVALGRAIHDRLERFESNTEQMLRVRRQIDSVPSARARLWDSFYDEQAQLQSAIAERTGAEPTELWVQLTSHLCLTIMQMSLDGVRASHGAERRSAVQYAADIALTLSGPSLVLPVLPS